MCQLTGSLSTKCVTSLHCEPASMMYNEGTKSSMASCALTLSPSVMHSLWSLPSTDHTGTMVATHACLVWLGTGAFLSHHARPGLARLRGLYKCLCKGQLQRDNERQTLLQSAVGLPLTHARASGLQTDPYPSVLPRSRQCSVSS